MREKISACVLTCNEERKIGRCLESLKWCDEIVVLDSFSSDRTPEIARGFTDRVFQHEWLGYVGQRNLLRGMARHPWVLFLDADEEVSPALRDEILKGLEGEPSSVCGYEFPRIVYYVGRWILHGEWFPDVKLRLFRKEFGRTEGQEPHDKVVVRGTVKRLRNPIWHYTHDNIHDHLETVNRFSTITARQHFVGGMPFRWRDLLLRPLIRFVRGYVVQKGFLDGSHGFVIAVLNSYGVFAKYAKLWEFVRSSRPGFQSMPRSMSEGSPRPAAAGEAGRDTPAGPAVRPGSAILAACLLAGSALSQTATGAVRFLSLPEAMDLALRQNRELRMAALSLEDSRLIQAAAEAAYLWTVQPHLGAETRDDTTALSSRLAVSRPTTWGTRSDVGGTLRVEDFDSASDWTRSTVFVQLEQPLLRGGPLIHRESLVAAAAAAAATKREIEMRSTDLIVQVVEGYEALLRLQRQMENGQRSGERLERALRLTEVRERQGRAAALDSMRMRLQRNDRQLRLAETAERLRVAQAEFAEVLGRSPDEVFAVLPAARLEVLVTNAADVAAAALSNRLDYAQVLQDQADARRGLRIARRNLLPDVKLISRYEHVQEDYGSSETSGFTDDIWFVGLGLGDGLPDRSEGLALERRELDMDRVALRVEAVESALRRQALQAFMVYGRLRDEVPLARQNREIAAKRARLAARYFEMGNGDSSAVSEAEDERRAAEDRLLTTEADASVAAYRLLRVMGTLTASPPELKPGA